MTTFERIFAEARGLLIAGRGFVLLPPAKKLLLRWIPPDRNSCQLSAFGGDTSSLERRTVTLDAILSAHPLQPATCGILVAAASVAVEDLDQLPADVLGQAILVRPREIVQSRVVGETA